MPVPRLPLIVTGDPGLLDDLLRLAAAGGSEVDVAADPVAARPRYAVAPFVAIGEDQLQACVRARLSYRTRVAVVTRQPPTPALIQAAERLRIRDVAQLPAAHGWIIDQFAGRFGTAGERSESVKDGRIVAVIGGRGGAGASILAGGLAVTAARSGLRTLLVDADPLGGGLDLLLGWERVKGLRWPSLAETGGRVDPPALLSALPHEGDLVLLSFDRDEMPAEAGDAVLVPAEAMASTLDAGRRGRDLVVVDLPRHLDDAAALALQAADKTLLIVPAELRAAASAVRVAKAVRMHCADVSLVVRGPAPGKLRPREVSAALHLPLAGALRPERSLCDGLEQGKPPASSGRGPLADLCQALVGKLFDETSAGAAA